MLFSFSNNHFIQFQLDVVDCFYMWRNPSGGTQRKDIIHKCLSMIEQIRRCFQCVVKCDTDETDFIQPIIVTTMTKIKHNYHISHIYVICILPLIIILNNILHLRGFYRSLYIYMKKLNFMVIPNVMTQETKIN